MEALNEVLVPPRLRRLCRVEDIADPGAKGFPPAPGGFTGLFAVRRDGHIRVFVNACPHIGIALDWAPDRFLSVDGQFIVCSTHGAEFRIVDGFCVRGPCQGDALESVLTQIRDGELLVPEDAGL